MRLKKPVFRSALILTAIPLLLLAAFLFEYLPGHERSFCAVRFGTGVCCPGCGIITAVSLFLHGRFFPSLEAHPLGWLVVVWLVLIWLKNLTGREFGLKYLSYFLCAGLLIVWSLKMGGVFK